MMGFFTDRKEYKKLQTRVIGNGRYRLEKRLGQGGFGTTWLAADQENQQKVVVKELCPPQGEKREKEIRNFLREARVMASLHAVKEIVKVLNYFEEQGNAYIVMEYLRVTSLRHYLECQEEPLSFEKARDMLLPVMEGLDKMHGKNILHRDLTPDNLMLREDGSLFIFSLNLSLSASELTLSSPSVTIYRLTSWRDSSSCGISFDSRFKTSSALSR
jgi:serine/threonine protein kinase